MLQKPNLQRVVQNPMSKILLGLSGSLLMLMLLVVGVRAQTPPTTPLTTTLPAGNVTAASAAVAQQLPITLTLTVAGPDGPLTVEVPLLLALDIRLDLRQSLTGSLVVTPTVAIDVATVITELPELDAAAVTTVTAVTTDTTDTTDSLTEVSAPATATPAPEVAEATPTPATPAEPTNPESTDTAPAPAAPTATLEPLPTPTPTAAPAVVAAACPDNRSVISAPGVNETLSGVVEISGTAVHDRFQYYKVEYAAGSDAEPSFAFLAASSVSIQDGLLATFDSADFSNGAYTLKLTVVDNTGNFPPPCTVPVFIQN
jgi:hypothetical protein